MRYNKPMKRGFSLIEIAVGVAVLLAAFVAVIGAFQLALQRGRATLERIQAATLAEEGVEALALLRDAAWSNLSSLVVGTPYDLVLNGAAWATTQIPQTIDGVFRRAITIGEVYRHNADKDIVPADSPDPKSVDAGTRKIVVRVAWATSTPSGGGEEVLEAYLMNLFE